MLDSASLSAVAIAITAPALLPADSAPGKSASVVRATLALAKCTVLPSGDRFVAVSARPKDGGAPTSLYARDLSRLE